MKRLKSTLTCLSRIQITEVLQGIIKTSEDALTGLNGFAFKIQTYSNFSPQSASAAYYSHHFKAIELLHREGIIVV